MAITLAAKRKAAAAPAKKRGRPAKYKNDKARKAARQAQNYKSYVKNRKKRLTKQRAYYRANKEKIKARIKRWRKKTDNGRNPLYKQGKKNGKRPINPRLPRLFGKTKGKRVGNVGKKPAKSGAAFAKKRGRPKGSKNKPKAPAASVKIGKANSRRQG